MEFGVLMPHSGDYADPQMLLRSARNLEEWGFDSLWVRDHLVWKPHAFEGQARTFIDAVVTMSAMAAVTTKIKIGAAVLIPIRWPLKVAQDLSSLSYMSGGRFEAGMGMGGNPVELGSAGFTVEEREVVFTETVEICRKIWAEDNVSYNGKKFSFENVTIRPKPVNEIPIWYGGSTQASIRRALDCCDGWLPGRLPLATLDKRLAYMKEQSEARGRTVRTGVIPILNIDVTREKAREGIDIDALAHSSEGSVHWVKPASGEFKTFDDFEGALIAGSPEDCINEINKFKARNIDLFVFDIRLQFDKFEEKMEMIAREVVPYVR